MVGFLPRRNQVFAAVVDIKAARLGFCRLEAFNCQNAAVFGDAEDGDQTGGTVTGIQVTAIRRDVNVCRPACVREIRWHHVQRLYALDLPVRIVQLPHVYRAVQLVNDIGILLIRVEDHVARACAFNGGDFRRALRDQMAVIAQGKQADAVLLKRWHPQRAVIRRNVGGVATFEPFYHVDGFNGNTVFQAGDAHAACIVGAAEDKVAFMVSGNMGRAARQRGFCGIGQRAVIRGDAVCQYAEFGAYADIKKTFIRADDHRLHLAWHINNLNQRKRTFCIQTPDMDLLTFRTGGINGLFHEYS
ncbi:Uncharacterised protein [Enterobacter hormaechei]|nr:Uncharacterised protein [Enterobacter hormaechei]